MKKLAIISVIILMFIGQSCNTNTGAEQENAMADKNELDAVFPKGEKGSSDLFTGNAWATSLVENDSTYNTLIGNVYFEPGARSNWHRHPAGQILIITAGEGYHQIRGEARQTMRKGDVIECPPNVVHWHGAAPETGLQQMYIIPNTEKGIVEWLEPVTNEQYNNTK